LLLFFLVLTPIRFGHGIVSDTARLVKSDTKRLGTKSSSVVDGTTGGRTRTGRPSSSGTDTDKASSRRGWRTLLRLRRRSIEYGSRSRSSSRDDGPCSGSTSFSFSPLSREGLMVLRKHLVGDMGSGLSWSLHHSGRRRSVSRWRDGSGRVGSRRRVSTDDIICVIRIIDTTPLVGSTRCRTLEIVHGSSELSSSMTRGRRR
jgi:hypothetical protein